MSEPEVPVTEDVEGVFDDRMNDLIFRLENTSKETKNIANELKVLKKEHGKIVKKMSGSRRKKSPKDPNAPKKAPSGFAKPTKISSELAAFLAVPEGDLIARPDVTKGITRYVKEHNLQKEENKRIIDLTKPGGEALVKLLNVPEGAELTFFNLQKYLKIHFPVSVKEPKEVKPKVKKVKEPVVEEAPVETPVVEVKPKKVKKEKVAAEVVASVEEPVVAPVKTKKAKVAKEVVAEPVSEPVPVEEVPVEEVKSRRRRRPEA